MKLPGGNWPLRVATTLGVIAFAVLLFFTVRILLVPFVSAMFLAYLFEPAIAKLQRRGMDRGKAYIVLFSVTTVLLVAFFAVAPSWLQVPILAPGLICCQISPPRALC